MMRIISVLSLPVALLVLTQSGGIAMGQDLHSSGKTDPAKEIETLKQKVDDLEKQNREMLKLIEELRSILVGQGRRSVPAAASAETRDAVRPDGLHQAPERISARAQSSQSRPQPIPASGAPREPAGATTQQSGGASQSSGDAVHWSELLGGENRLKLYGFLRLDLDIDSQRPNNGQIPLFITSQDPRLGGDGGSFSMHPRLTRFGLDYAGPRISALGEAKLGGKFEVDFENGGSESRQIIRIRQAYFTLKSNDVSILGGQAWDIVSPLFPTVNGDSLMWNAGNIGDRRPQFRVAYEPQAGKSQWSFVGGVGLTGAIDLLDLDNNGFRDGEESARPNVQARVGFSRALWVKDQRMSLGLSGEYGWLATTRPVAGRTDFRTQVVNVDYILPLADIVSLRGEGWWGRNLSDIRGGAGQGLNVLNGRDVRARGGWTEFGVKVSRYWSVHPGFSVDDPVDIDFAAGARTRNRAFYVGNRITPGGNFLIGVDYLRWRTDFKGFLRGIDNRVNIFFQYGF